MQIFRQIPFLTNIYVMCALSIRNQKTWSKHFHIVVKKLKFCDFDIIETLRIVTNSKFPHLFRCFLMLLLLAAILWKIKQKYDLYRRRQRLIVEMEQMASRPFSEVMFLLNWVGTEVHRSNKKAIFFSLNSVYFHSNLKSFVHFGVYSEDQSFAIILYN